MRAGEWSLRGGEGGRGGRSPGSARLREGQDGAGTPGPGWSNGVGAGTLGDQRGGRRPSNPDPRPRRDQGWSGVGDVGQDSVETGTSAPGVCPRVRPQVFSRGGPEREKGVTGRRRSGGGATNAHLGVGEGEGFVGVGNDRRLSAGEEGDLAVKVGGPLAVPPHAPGGGPRFAREVHARGPAAVRVTSLPVLGLRDSGPGYRGRGQEPCRGPGTTNTGIWVGRGCCRGGDGWRCVPGVNGGRGRGEVHLQM